MLLFVMCVCCWYSIIDSVMFVVVVIVVNRNICG